MTFALAIGLVYKTRIYGDSILDWFSVENMKIPTAVGIGDTIRVHAKVKEKRETKNPSKGIINVSGRSRIKRMKLSWHLIMF